MLNELNEFRDLLIQHGWQMYDKEGFPGNNQCNWYAMKAVDDPAAPECASNQKPVMFVLTVHVYGGINNPSIYYELHITAQTAEQNWFSLQSYGSRISEWERNCSIVCARLIAAWKAVNVNEQGETK